MLETWRKECVPYGREVQVFTQELIYTYSTQMNAIGMNDHILMGYGIEGI